MTRSMSSTLKPVLSLKVDELFRRWLGEPETQHLLKTNLRQIVKGEPITHPSYGNYLSSKPSNSPRHRPGSPRTPPCIPNSKITSPRNSKRSASHRHAIRALSDNETNLKEVHDVAAPVEFSIPVSSAPHRSESSRRHSGSDVSLSVRASPAPPVVKDARADPDGHAGDSFLRQKEAQLRERRQQQQQQQQQRHAKATLPLVDQPAARERLGAGDSLQAVNHLANATPISQISKSDATPTVPNSSQLTHDSDISAAVSRTRTSTPSPLVGCTRPGSDNTITKSAPHTIQVNSSKLARRQQQQQSVTSPVVAGPPVPKFYYPMGRPGIDAAVILGKLKDVFSKLDDGCVTIDQMSDIAKVCGCPLSWRRLLWRAASVDKQTPVSLQAFQTMWRKVISTCHDEASRLVRLLAKPGSTCLEAEDLVPLVQDVVDTHPGLTFLQDAPEFHSRYVLTVIARIFYSINKSWTGKITIPELRKGNFLKVLHLLDEEEDINQVTDYFSYEHFYVIYCKFWELDKDHDLFLSKEDLLRHNDHAISSRMIDRVLSGAVTKGATQKDGRMSYPDFVWFLISEEDKRHPRSIEYWFRCMDLDGDGFISMYEMEYFYEEQVHKMEALGIETLPFDDCLCQMLDMVKPVQQNKISLHDLKTCRMTPVFFDTFFNLEKYLEHEQKDPFACLKDGEEPELSDWERYANEEYDILVAEEGVDDPAPTDSVPSDEINYEDDFEIDEDLPSLGATQKISSPVIDACSNSKLSPTDAYNFSTSNLTY